MRYWQESYLLQLLASGIDKTTAEVNRLKSEIKHVDKRTRYGKSTVIFSGASLAVAEDALRILTGEEIKGHYFLMNKEFRSTTNVFTESKEREVA